MKYSIWIVEEQTDDGGWYPRNFVYECRFEAADARDDMIRNEGGLAYRVRRYVRVERKPKVKP